MTSACDFYMNCWTRFVDLNLMSFPKFLADYFCTHLFTAMVRSSMKSVGSHGSLFLMLFVYERP